MLWVRFFSELRLGAVYHTVIPLNRGVARLRIVPEGTRIAGTGLT